LHLRVRFGNLSTVQQGDDVKEIQSPLAISSNSFLMVDTRLLDADGEMRRMFSSGVVSNNFGIFEL
jgi:hypothetical protein